MYKFYQGRKQCMFYKSCIIGFRKHQKDVFIFIVFFENFKNEKNWFFSLSLKAITHA